MGEDKNMATPKHKYEFVQKLLRAQK